LVEFDGFKLEVNPEGHLLLYRNVDRPGMLAKVGAELASAGINIGGLALGRDKPGQTALTVISVDTPIPTEILARVGRIEGVFEVRTVSL
jgi:D-3-phosphoglycerate dehydrogenase